METRELIKNTEVLATDNNLLGFAVLFETEGEPRSCERYGSGHINFTYLVVDSAGHKYIMQRINQKVFRDPRVLMENAVAVTEYLRAGSSGREALTFVPVRTGEKWHVDDSGEYWRMYEYVADSICFTKVESLGDFRESGWAFGNFQRLLGDFPASVLHETIPRFHDTPDRFENFKRAQSEDAAGRAGRVGGEIEFALKREGYANLLVGMLKSGELPLRVTHNDTKLSNVLFDINTRKALCVIDMDTIMPGLSVYDYGDSIRFGASTAAEDERDLGKVNLSMELLGAYTEGFLSSCGGSLTKNELECLRDGSKMMTLECGVRFLTDYLNGDVYFKTDRPDQNLDRCKTQFKLVSEMERRWDEMRRVILKG